MMYSLQLQSYSPNIYLVTTGSAAWLGPHLPSNPLPTIPVLPTGFLSDKELFITDGFA